MPRKKVKTPVSTKICTECGKEKPLSQFYTTRNSNISTDGKTVNICKSCVKKGSYNSDGSLNSSSDSPKERSVILSPHFLKAPQECHV